MSPLAGVALGAAGVAVGAIAATLFGPQIARTARPVAKSALKTALVTLHAARVRGAELVEVAEDLYAEAKAEATAEVLAAAFAAAQEKAAAAKAKAQEVEPAAQASVPTGASAAAG